MQVRDKRGKGLLPFLIRQDDELLELALAVRDMLRAGFNWEDAMAENWLDLAPEPPPLAPGKAWHVFISYRSVNRPWVLALYDVLNGLGYKTFLDQYVLTAAARDSHLVKQI